MQKFNSEPLRRWFLERRRDLPWRQEPTPYHVWISEVMLQQTQVAVVIPYYLRWIERFPSIEALAAAPLEAVIKEWEGLGYYSRARNLHSAARDLVENYGGQLPRDPARLATIKGIGPYMVGAICSFAFHEKKAAVDGNVIRVLSRLFAIEDDCTKPSTINRLRALAESLLPDKEPWVITEALIELGAMLCKKRPQCHHCPLSSQCRALATGVAEELPYRSKRAAATPLYRAVAVIHCAGALLLRPAKQGQVMEGLYEFPYFETCSNGYSPQQLVDAVHKDFDIAVTYGAPLASITHGFTRYRATLTPALLAASTPKTVPHCEWHALADIDTLPFSAGHRRILQRLHDLLAA